MKRKISLLLSEWKNREKRMPLVVNGARQVGKTFILEQFGTDQFKNSIYLNMELEGALNSFLNTELSPLKIIQFIEASKGQVVTTGETLLFFDEIQACERALTALKYFCEQMPELHIVAAGSLLGVAINREKYAYPVGKVEETTLFPLDFEEYLWAVGKEKLANEIRSCFTEQRPMQEAYHQMALEQYQHYFIVGGMPASVIAFVETSSFLKAQQIQHNILNQYIADMAKYANPATSLKIRACYESIPTQLAKENTKFQYKIVQRGGTSTIFGESIEWLIYSGIAHKCKQLEHGYIPINAYVDLSNFKLYMGDIGMLTLRSEMPLQTILSPHDEANTYLGAMTENYVAQALATNAHSLLYWQSEGKAEVDFILQLKGKVVPLEVKKGMRTRSKSLSVFTSKYKTEYAIRISKKNFGFENGILSVPLYAVFCI
jgi:uncharacterized protein